MDCGRELAKTDARGVVRVKMRRQTRHWHVDARRCKIAYCSSIGHREARRREARADQIRMYCGLRGVNGEPWRAVHANNELVLAGFRHQRGMRLCGAYVLEIYLRHGAWAGGVQDARREAYRGYQSTEDARVGV